MAAILQFRRGGSVVSNLTPSEPFFNDANDTFHIGTDGFGAYITLAKLDETNNGSFIASGNITATSYYGDGSNLTGIATSSYDDTDTLAFINSQNVLSGSGYLLNTTDTLDGDLTVTGKLTAREFHAEYMSSSIIYESGSTKFGDSLDDFHQFTGSVDINGSMTITDSTLVSNLNADLLDSQQGTYYLNYSNFTNIPSGIISGSSQLDGTTIDNLTITNGTVATTTLEVDISKYSTAISPTINTTTVTVALVPTGSYDAVFFDYVIKEGVNLRAGTLITVHDGTSTNITDNTTTDLGDTSGLLMDTDIFNGNIRLQATTTTNGWVVKTIIRTI